MIMMLVMAVQKHPNLKCEIRKQMLTKPRVPWVGGMVKTGSRVSWKKPSILPWRYGKMSNRTGFYAAMAVVCFLIFPRFSFCSQVSVVKFSDVKVTRVCEIRRNSSYYLGRLVHVRGVYKTDHSFYSFLFDALCPSLRAINVADAFYAKGDASVVDFFKRESQMCSDNKSSVCPSEAGLNALAIVRRQQDGKLFLELKSVDR